MKFNFRLGAEVQCQDKLHGKLAAVVIESGMAVNTLEGSIGKVDFVISDRVSGKITHLVIHHGLIFAERLIIPISAVEDIEAERILIADTNEGLNQFAPYSPEIMDQVLAE